MKRREDPFHDWDVAYVLGSLPPNEIAQYELHLRSCPGCAEEVAALGALPAVLAAVHLDEVATLVGSRRTDAAALIPGLLRATAQARRRAQFWMLVAFAAATVLGLVLLALV